MTDLQIFSTCPAWSSGPDRRTHLDRVREAARWSEAAGCAGMLIYTDNTQPDPWVVAQAVVEESATLRPLVAVQPVYMHPYTVAKLVATFGHLFGRQVVLNMVAGGFTNDLKALSDAAGHDRRYDRLVEYTEIVKRLIASSAPLNFEGEFYQTFNLKLDPPLPADLAPMIFVSGSSDAGLAAARALGARAIKYPKPPAEEPDTPADGLECGIRVGILARRTADDAWADAQARFPPDRKGELTHQLAMKVSDSKWHHQLSEHAKNAAPAVYWLGPFERYQTMCPYLVGSYGRVAAEVARYIDRGYRTFILDIPADADDLVHTTRVFEEATERLGVAGPAA
jgi:alkanesulfonate monooxygenase